MSVIDESPVERSSLKSAISAVMAVSTMMLTCLARADVTPNQVPESIQKQVRNLRTDLESKGFEVMQGSWKLFTIADCKYAIASLGNCLGNNPAAPYVVPTVPHWSDEFVDEKMKDVFGPTASDTSWTYRLDPREAIVIIGKMPPAGAYFGVQSYVFSREGMTNTADAIYGSLKDMFMRGILFMSSPNPTRPLVFSSIGDSNNNVVIEKRSGGSFGQERSFIITPDAGMERRMTNALRRAGVSDRKHIFVERVSNQLVRTGLEAKADDMITLMRYALPDDEVAGEQWRQQLPLVVLRVRDKNLKRPVAGYAEPIREVRIARSELGMKGEAEKLVAAVKEKWAQKDVPSVEFESLLLKVDLLGPNCLKRPQNCLGDSADADYQISATVGLDSGEVLAVVGTLGTATGNATYTSLSVNQIPALKGVLNISHKNLAGSANEFSGAVQGADKFYVQYFARDCRKLEHCTQIDETAVPRGDQLKIIQRNYVAQGSNRGPDPTKVVEPTLIVLKQ